MKLTSDIDIIIKCLWNVRFQVKRSKVKVTVFSVSAPWLRAYLTDLLHTWHKCSPWRDDVSRSIFRSRSHRSFEMKVTPVIRSFCHVRSVAPCIFG